MLVTQVAYGSILGKGSSYKHTGDRVVGFL